MTAQFPETTPKPHAPTQPIPAVPPPPAPPRRATNRLALLVSGLALLVALGSGVVALYALGKASARTQNTGTSAPAPTTGGGPAPTGARPPAPTTQGTDVTPGPPASPGVLDPHANYASVYQGKQLTLHVACTGGTNNVDLDEPRVNTTNYDLQLYCYSGEEYFHWPDGVQVVDAPGVGATPNDCVDAMQRGALGDGAHVPVTNQVVLCVATSFGDAVTQGIAQKIVVVQVQQVAKDGTVTITASSWAVPD